MSLPMILVMQRKSVRMFPGNIEVGLYYCPDVDKYYSVSSDGKSLTEETGYNETPNPADKRK